MITVTRLPTKRGAAVEVLRAEASGDILKSTHDSAAEELWRKAFARGAEYFDGSKWITVKVGDEAFLDALAHNLFQEGYVLAADKAIAGIFVDEGELEDFKQLAPPTEAIDRLLEAESKAFATNWWNGLDQVTRERLRGAIRSNVQQGLSFTELTKSIEPLFGETRALRIASTETTRLFAKGAMLSYQQAGVKMVQWRTAQDPWTCSRCRPLEGQSWRIGENEEPPLHVSCRCHIFPMLEKAVQPLELAGDDLVQFIDNPYLRHFDYLEGEYLTRTNVDALGQYSGAFGEELNAVLRKGGPAPEKMFVRAQQGLDDAMRKSRPRQPLVTWRGGNISGLPGRPGSGVGIKFSDLSYTSVSADWATAYDYVDSPGEVLMKIILKPDQPCIALTPWSKFPTEAEILLPRGSTFRIVSDALEALGPTFKKRVLTLEIV
jgi:SPP1 gp7 family putative phage head morphogenesis protein